MPHENGRKRGLLNYTDSARIANGQTFSLASFVDKQNKKLKRFEFSTMEKAVADLFMRKVNMETYARSLGVHTVRNGDISQIYAVKTNSTNQHATIGVENIWNATLYSAEKTHNMDATKERTMQSCSPIASMNLNVSLAFVPGRSRKKFGRLA